MFDMRMLTSQWMRAAFEILAQWNAYGNELHVILVPHGHRNTKLECRHRQRILAASRGDLPDISTPWSSLFANSFNI